MSNDSRLAVLNAMSLLGNKTDKGDTQQDNSSNRSSIPTAKTRSAIELLFRSNVEDLRAAKINMKQVSSDLFDWSGAKRSTKTVMRALSNALNTPGKYDHTVELASFAAAMAPLLEPDRLARLFNAVSEVRTLYAPNLYTLQLSHQLSELFSRYPEQVRENLAYDMWVSAHNGRWWDLTTGVELEAVEGAVEPEEDPEEAADQEQTQMTNKELIEAYIGSNLAWDEDVANKFETLPYDEKVIGFLREYNTKYSQGRTLDPDIGLLSSYIPWVPLQERVESPIGVLLRELIGTIESVEGYELPDKPRSFKSLFPDIRLIVGNNFPFPNELLATNNLPLLKGVTLEIIATPAQLMENKEYMGNCTWTYKKNMEDCKYVLYKVHDKRNGEIYNAAMDTTGSKQKGRWKVREIQGRHNRGGVPQDVRSAFNKFTEEAPFPTESFLNMVENTNSKSGKKFGYRLY